MVHPTNHDAKRRMIRRLCLDVLQRGPTAAELRAYTGFPVDKVAARMLGTVEACQVFVEAELLYFLLLDNFRPKTEAIRTLPTRLHRGQATAHDAIAEIMTSSGFAMRNPGNDTFVTVVLEQGLGMRVQDKRNAGTLALGKRMYDGYKVRFLGSTGTSQADVVKIVVAHPDFTRHLLDRFHRRVLRGPLPRNDQAKAQISRVHGDHRQFFTVLTEWFASPEYAAQLKVMRPRSDNQFIRSLYFDLLGRAPRYQELRNMRNALLSMADPGPLRAVMAKVILDSGKAVLPEVQSGGAPELVREAFLRYLGREPSQDELAKFTAVLGEPGVDVRHLVRALVTSSEYQYY